MERLHNQPLTSERLASLESSHLWLIGLTVDDQQGADRTPGTASRTTPWEISFDAECACPADCLRDHQNE